MGAGAVAIPWGGKPPGEEGWLERIAKAMKDGRLPNPQKNPMAYGLFGLLLGFAMGMAGWL